MAGLIFVWQVKIAGCVSLIVTHTQELHMYICHQSRVYFPCFVLLLFEHVQLCCVAECVALPDATETKITISDVGYANDLDFGVFGA